jgi:hypothetical protein
LKADELRDLIMGTEEASKLWGLSQDHIKKLCRLGRCEAIQIGKTWIIMKNQPNPKMKPRGEKDASKTAD